MSILTTLFYIVLCVLLFAFAILIHEFGHFVVALKLGLRVDAFSIGFGPALWKKKFKGVEYRICWILLGGYVSLPDLDPEGTKVIEGQGGEKTEKDNVPRVHLPAWKQIAVAFAGPFMNIVLAVVIAVVLSLIPSAKFGTLAPKIGRVIKDGPAEKAGLKAGDCVKSVAGHPVETWSEMQTELQIAGGKTVTFIVERGGATPEEVSLSVTPRRDEVSGAWYILALSETNRTGAVSWMPARSPWKQLAWDAGSIFRVLKGLVTPKEVKATAGALGGPVLIAEGLYCQVRRDPLDGLGFLRFLNMNLAILNLLPIPVLDGGLIFFALIALVFRRRVPASVINTSSFLFMVLLMGLMGVLILRDSWRSYKIHTFDPKAEKGAATNVTHNATR